MPESHPTLREMGVSNPDQIVSYDLIQTEPTEDMLRLRYQRPHGSRRPVSRIYHFARTPRAALSSDTPGLIDYEISPFLSKALDELDGLVRSHSDRHAVLDEIVRQIDGMERDFRAEMRTLRGRLSRLSELG